MKSKENLRQTASGDIVKIQSGFELTNEEIETSVELYRNYRDNDDEACHIGLYGEDLEIALKDPETILFKYKSPTGENVALPLLVPIEKLEWYNAEVLHKEYGEETKLYCYTHPPMPLNIEHVAEISDVIREKIEGGAVIILDQYADRPLPLVLQSIVDNGECEFELFGDDTERKVAPTYCGRVKFDGIDTVDTAPTLFEAYKKALASGKIENDNANGISLLSLVEDEEAEEIWNVYDKPFQDLGAEDPVIDGFDKEYLTGILKDPEVPKIVTKKDGKICALCFFDRDFDKNPWFNKEYFRKNYPEYYETNNIYMFPGIVASQDAKGITYGIEMINFATQLFAEMHTNAMVTFECSQESAKYIPKITKFAVDHSGVAKLEDSVLQPVTVTEYIAVKKSTKR